MFIVTRIWISISDLDLNSIIESHNENFKNLVNFIIIIKMANGMGSVNPGVSPLKHCRFCHKPAKLHRI